MRRGAGHDAYKLQTARTEWDLVALNEEFVALSLFELNGIPSVVFGGWAVTFLCLFGAVFYRHGYTLDGGVRPPLLFFLLPLLTLCLWSMWRLPERDSCTPGFPPQFPVALWAFLGFPLISPSPSQLCVSAALENFISVGWTKAKFPSPKIRGIRDPLALALWQQCPSSPGEEKSLGKSDNMQPHTKFKANNQTINCWDQVKCVWQTWMAF